MGKGIDNCDEDTILIDGDGETDNLFGARQVPGGRPLEGECDYRRLEGEDFPL